MQKIFFLLNSTKFKKSINFASNYFSPGKFQKPNELTFIEMRSNIVQNKMYTIK